MQKSRWRNIRIRFMTCRAEVETHDGTALSAQVAEQKGKQNQEPLLTMWMLPPGELICCSRIVCGAPTSFKRLASEGPHRPSATDGSDRLSAPPASEGPDRPALADGPDRPLSPPDLDGTDGNGHTDDSDRPVGGSLSHLAGPALPDAEHHQVFFDMNAPKVAEEVGNFLFCASKGDVAGIQKLLEQGMPVDAADYDGRTALHLGASEGHVAVVNFLLENKADPNPIDRNGDTPLANAKDYGHEEVCKILETGRGFIKTRGLHEFEIPITELNMDKGKFIGKGAFGEIRVVKWRGTIVAAKTITTELSKDPQILKEFVDELALLSNLSHPNIVQFLGAVTKQRPMVMVTEYLPKGDLHDLMERKGKLDAGTSVRFALDIARGMNYLHQNKPNAIVHRDLKPRNILKHDAGHLKVADFGLGKLLDPLAADKNALYEMTGETGSYRYMAPEVFMHKNYDKSVDVFSFAIIVQEMFEGSSSLKYQLPKSIAISRAKNMQRPSFNVSYPPGMKELIKECWDSDPSKRPTFAECIKRLEKIQVDGRLVKNVVVSEETEKRDKCTIM